MSSEILTVAGQGLPLVGNDIDTDRIIPARFLRCITFDGLGSQVFADDRSALQGQHPFDQSQYQGAQILVVNANFGCGSSREHAPQALQRWGIRAIIGESFAEIFFGNCVSIGVPCVTVDPATVRQIQETLTAHPETVLQVDLSAKQVQCGDQTIPANMGEGFRQMLTTGSWDACGQLIAQATQIQATAAQLPYLAWAKSA